jgi:NadR type nicotinamide-nucleotide adenylyltransferase
VKGLVLGKFMPPHAGHLQLIETAYSRVDDLTVLVCSLAREPIPGALRFAWMRELVPGARVIHVTDENPSEPHEHPRFWEMWTDTIRRAVPDGIDLVFTSEDYGDELARRLGARHVLVDRERRSVAVSGTAVRARPLAHWDHLPAPVRAYYARRVAIVGSESTGKTLLARELAGYFGTVWVPEFARGYLDAKPAPLDRSDIEPIARGQIETEDRAAREANRVLVLDTTVLSTVVYAGHYYEWCPEWIRRAAVERRADRYLLTDIDVPWVSDPQRDRPHMREQMHALFRQALESRGLPYVLVRGDWAERLRIARDAVAELLREPDDRQGTGLARIGVR